MSNIALQIERTLAGRIGVEENVIFDNTVYSAGNISYDSVTGVITFNEAGRYLINWWVATQSSQSPSGVVFALSSSQGDFLEGDSPAKTGEIVGVGIINVSAPPVTAFLVNASLGSHDYPGQVPLESDTGRRAGYGGGGGRHELLRRKAVNQYTFSNDHGVF